ncbi:MAG: putative toxin-antitoxin system toxin component, PIN family [Candidatus Aminicenantales bacterium]|jgi:putative PIN family toxin of toxin-antitoxin system
MIRAVIDTNVIVASLIHPAGTTGAILSRLRDGAFTIVLSPALLDEIAAVMSYPKIRDKYGIRTSDMEVIAGLLALRGQMAMPTEAIHVCRDPDDDILLEAAVAGEAEYIVSGDEDLLAIRKFRMVRIVKPAVFLAILDKAGR